MTISVVITHYPKTYLNIHIGINTHIYYTYIDFIKYLYSCAYFINGRYLT